MAKKKEQPKISKEIIRSQSKPVCPGCEERDYIIEDYTMTSGGDIKFTVKCKMCKLIFSYEKSLDAI